MARNTSSPSRAPEPDLPGFRDPNEIAVRRASIRLLREILDYQRRLNRLLERADPDEEYLVVSCRKEIRIRRQLLRDLPQPVDREIPEPWRAALGLEKSEPA